MVKEKINFKVEQASINITNNQVDSIRFKNTNKTGFRVYDNNLIGVSGIVGEYNEDEMFNKAIDNLNNKIEYKASPEKNKKEKIKLINIKETDTQFLENIKSLVEKLHNKYPDIIFSNKVNLSKKTYSIKNDAGLDYEYSDGYYSFSILFKEKTSTNLMDMAFEGISRNYDEKKIIEDISEMIDNYKIKKDIEVGTYPIIIDFRYFSNYILSNTMATLVMSKASLFSNKIGQKVFSDNVTIIDDRNPQTAICSPFFDMEGVVNENYQFKLVDRGVFTTPTVSKKEAITYNLPLTGSAYSTYDSVPRCTPDNLVVLKSDKTLKELLNGEKGIYVVFASGGDFTQSGDYASPVQLAYLVEDGKITGRLDNLTITGNIFDMFGKNFIGRCKDSMFQYSDVCPLVIKMNVIK